MIIETSREYFRISSFRHRAMKHFVSYLNYFAAAIVEAWSLKIDCYFYTDM